MYRMDKNHVWGDGEEIGSRGSGCKANKAIGIGV